MVLPGLLFLTMATIDFSRVYYYSATVASCARNGALYACDGLAQADSPYTSVSQAALADASNLSPSPTVSSAVGVDSTGASYVEVTVTYTFQTIVNYPGIPSSSTVSRKVRMRVAPTTPS